MTVYRGFCCRYIESTRLGQLKLVNCDIFETTTIVQNNRSFSLNDCKGNMRVKLGQSAEDQQTTS